MTDGRVQVTPTLIEQVLAEWPTPLRQHISASSLKTAMRCKETFRRRYILGDKEPPNGNLIWGRADHTAFENNFRRKLDTKRDMSIADIKELYAVALDGEVEGSGGVTQVDWGNTDEPEGAVVSGLDPQRRALAKVKDDGVKLVELYQRNVSPRILPIAVEREFDLEIPGFPVPVKGRIDLEANVLPPAFFFDREAKPIHEVIDRKVRGRSGIKGEDRFAAFLYQLEQAIPVEFQLSLKTKVGRVMTGAEDEKLIVPVPPERRTLAMVKRTMIEVAVCWTVLGPGEPWPHALTHDWACNYCGFRPTCPWWTDALWKDKV